MDSAAKKPVSDGNTSTKNYPSVSPWFDLVEVEHEVLKFWEQNRSFEKLRELNKDNPTWSFLDGPITANNPMGVHHAWGRTLKDIFCRYHGMLGKRLRHQMGFDCQGLWVEVEVEKAHGFKSKRDIEELGIDTFIEECKARVRKYAKIQTDQSIRLGMWMDWENSYFTMSDENNYSIWSFLKKCHERGKIYRGNDVVPWSGRSGSSYSQMEVIEGRKLVTHTSVFVKFPLKDAENESLLVWTTTPWTLVANVAAAVNSELDYVKLKANRDGQIYYFADENLEFERLARQFKEKKDWIDGVPKLKTLAQIFKERGGYEVLGTVKGADLIGRPYQGPFDELEAQQQVGGYPFPKEGFEASSADNHKVVDGGRDKFGNAIVTAGEGTGIVHIAPGCGDVDHVLAKKIDLPMIAPLDENASYLEKFGPLAGKNVLDPETKKWIMESLSEKGLLFAAEEYPHVYPHCWRSGEELVFRVVDEWYINMDWRNEIIATLGEASWYPSWGQDRELEWLTNMQDWMISKKRFWGLALPIWVCRECREFEVIGSREELRNRATQGWETFDGHTPHRPWIDAVKIQCSACQGIMDRIEDVGNPWLDAGIVSFSTIDYPHDKKRLEDWYPADLILECFPGQFRNWFYSLLTMSVMMEGKAPFRNLVGHALVRDEQGKEMHKSTGNAIWFDDAVEKSGADLMRWLYSRQEPTTNLNFGYGALREIRGGFFNTLWNCYSFFNNYSRTVDFNPTERRVAFEDLPDFDRWILTELQKTIAVCREGLEKFDTRAATLRIEDFMEDLSNWYIRHNRHRFWANLESDDVRAAFETLYECLTNLLVIAAPIIPLLTEKIYQQLVRAVDPNAPESIHHVRFPQADDGKRDDLLAQQMRIIMKINTLALSTRNKFGLKVRQPLALLRVGPGDAIEKQAAERFQSMLARDLNVKKVQVDEAGAAGPLSYQVKPNFKALGPRFGSRIKGVVAHIAQNGDAILKAVKGDQGSYEAEINGETVTLGVDDLMINVSSPEGTAANEEGATWISFDITLTAELKLEGFMRDVLRALQDARKDIGLSVEDRISLSWTSQSARVKDMFTQWGDHVAKELLCTDLGNRQGTGEAKPLKVSGEPLEVWIAKVV